MRLLDMLASLPSLLSWSQKGFVGVLVHCALHLQTQAIVSRTMALNGFNLFSRSHSHSHVPHTKTGGRFRFAIDRGGTFTDIYAEQPDGSVRVMKLLSVDPAYADAPREGIRRILEEVRCGLFLLY